MRKRVRMTFLRGKNVKGFMGHWSMNYYVENIIDLENNELICSEYTFENSTLFKGMRLKSGDVVEMSIRIENKVNKIKLTDFSDVKKVIVHE